MKIKNNKVIIIILSVVVGILALSGIVTAFVLNYNVFSPEKVEILDDGQNVYISTTANDNYKSYRFKFIDSEKNEIIVDSEKNVLSLPELVLEGIEVGKTYQVSTCYLSDNDGNNSQFSETITWNVYSYLYAPKIEYDNKKDVLKWTEIENADNYKVFYNNDSDIVSVDTEETFFDLQTIKGGVREFYVVAYSNNESFRQSNKSNLLQIEVVHKFKDFIEVSLDNNSKILTIKSEEELDKFQVYIDGKSYDVIDFESEFIEDGNIYLFKLDISLIYKDSTNIGASPVTIDKFNIFNGNITYINNEMN